MVKAFEGALIIEKKLARRLAICPVKLIAMNKRVGEKEFKTEIMTNMLLSLVQFKNSWNAASQIVSKIYNDVANSYKGTANFFTVDIEEEFHLGKEYGINVVPTILFFKSGELIDSATGLIPRDVLIEKIENALSS